MVSTTKSGSDLQGVLIVDNVKPWWPYLMHPEYGYLYTLEISLCNEEQQDIDIYRLKVGIRTLAWDKSRFLINGEPVYFRGFGRHEDADVSGIDGLLSGRVDLTCIFFYRLGERV